MMRIPATVLIAFAIAIAGPASAQTVFETAALGAVQPCFTQQEDASVSPEELVKTCERTLESTKILKDENPAVAGHDRNILYVAVSIAETALAGAYGKIDKVRTQRVCDHVEKSWAALVNVDPAVSSEAYRKNFSDLRASALPLVKQCRAEKGTPAGAPPAN